MNERAKMKNEVKDMIEEEKLNSSVVEIPATAHNQTVISLMKVSMFKKDQMDMVHRCAINVGKLTKKLLAMDCLTVKWIKYMCQHYNKNDIINRREWQSLGDEWYYIIKKYRKQSMNEPIWLFQSLIWHCILPTKPIKNQFLGQCRIPWLPKQQHVEIPMSVYHFVKFFLKFMIF